MIIALLQWLLFYTRVIQLPDVLPERAHDLALVAISEATPQVPAALIVSLAWADSRFDRNARPACGVMQVYPRHLRRPESDCQLWRTDLRAGVRAGVDEIKIMLQDPRVGGNLRRALMYRACGNAYFTGACSKGGWVDAVLARARQLDATLKLDERRNRA